MKTSLIINPLQYVITPIQLENLCAEYFGRCAEILNGNEIEIEFETIVAKNQFIEVLDKTFKKNA